MEYLMLKYYITFIDVITYYSNVNPYFDFQVTGNDWLVASLIMNF